MTSGYAIVEHCDRFASITMTVAFFRLTALEHAASGAADDASGGVAQMGSTGAVFAGAFNKRTGKVRRQLLACRRYRHQWLLLLPPPPPLLLQYRC